LLRDLDGSVAMLTALRDFGPYGIIYVNVCGTTRITVVIAMLLRDFGPYAIIFMNVCGVIIVVIVMLLRDLGPYVIIFTTDMCLLL
jgi:fluoride ion exporter CrcB/FEX